MAVEDSVAQDQIRAFIERIERMEEEKAALVSDIKEIYAEAKVNGFDTKILRKIVTIRKQDANERMEQEALLELYMGALGMIPMPPDVEEERERLNSLASKVEASLRSPKPAEKPDALAALKADPALSIVSAANIKKSEPQPPQPAGSGLADPEPLDQVADIEPEAATNPADDGSDDAPKAVTDKPVEPSGSAAPAGLYSAPGVVTWEDHPPEGVERHAVSVAFSNMGQDPVLIEDELRTGRAQPIVKMGKVIIDGWARFMIARGMTETALVDGVSKQVPIQYAVVQYDGTDPLLDAIRWNIQGRVLTEQQRRMIAKSLSSQPEFKRRRDDIYAAFELGMELVS